MESTKLFNFSDIEKCGCDKGPAVGCNANNSNAVRYVNSNNSASNSNSNWGGVLAESKSYQNYNKSEKANHTTQPKRLKKAIGNYIGIAECSQREYEAELALFSDGVDLESDELQGTTQYVNIWAKLKSANSKRNLKNLSKFYRSEEIAIAAVQRCCESRDTGRKQRYFDRAETVAKWMIRVIQHGTYRVTGFQKVKLEPTFSTGKVREPEIFDLFDRCVQMFVLIIIEQKLRRKVIRNNFSNIEGRGIYCNNKTYCMLNYLRTASWKYPNDYVLITDIKKFYESTNWKIVCGILFRTIKDYTTRKLIIQTFEAAGSLIIGSCLSPLFADLVLQDYDDIVLKKFKPDVYVVYGDDRIFYFKTKEEAEKMLHYSISYYAGAYNISLKNNWQIKPANKKFSFCRKQFENGFVQERAEIKRRAIKVAKSPSQFAGYYGMFKKTDSKYLLHLIKYNYKSLRKRVC